MNAVHVIAYKLLTMFVRFVFCFTVTYAFVSTVPVTHGVLLRGFNASWNGRHQNDT